MADWVAGANTVTAESPADTAAEAISIGALSDTCTPGSALTAEAAVAPAAPRRARESGAEPLPLLGGVDPASFSEATPSTPRPAAGTSADLASTTWGWSSWAVSDSTDVSGTSISGSETLAGESAGP
eukprot:scaffold57768_cov25-Tisochrysis_lutea.AAC.3